MFKTESHQMKTLTKLTAKQEAELAPHRERWLSIGLDCAPFQKGRAEHAVKKAYACAGLPPPKFFIHLDSPMRGAIGATMLKNWAQVREQVRAQVGAQVYRAGYGQHDASWLGFYEYFHKVCNLSCCEKLSGLIEVAQECGWWWPFTEGVIITPKPKAIGRDDQGRLHNTSGPAIIYPDGWGIWAVHGVRVAQYIIEQPEQITVAKIDAEQNAEIRRVMISRYKGGEAGYIQDSGAQKIHEDDYGTLYRKDLPGDEPVVMVNVINSTPEPDGSFKPYWIRVPPTVTTARAAVAWSFGVEESQYEPAVET